MVKILDGPEEAARKEREEAKVAEWRELSTRRRKFLVGASDLIDIFRIVPDGKTISLPKLPLPPDATIATVYYSAPQKAFGFIAVHPDWDKVPEGSVAPEFLLNVEWQTYRIQTVEHGTDLAVEEGGAADGK